VIVQFWISETDAGCQSLASGKHLHYSRSPQAPLGQRLCLCGFQFLAATSDVSQRFRKHGKNSLFMCGQEDRVFFRGEARPFEGNQRSHSPMRSRMRLAFN
jgi:hypothetical protein